MVWLIPDPNWYPSVSMWCVIARSVCGATFTWSYHPTLTSVQHRAIHITFLWIDCMHTRRGIYSQIRATIDLNIPTGSVKITEWTQIVIKTYSMCFCITAYGTRHWRNWLTRWSYEPKILGSNPRWRTLVLDTKRQEPSEWCKLTNIKAACRQSIGLLHIRSGQRHGTLSRFFTWRCSDNELRQ